MRHVKINIMVFSPFSVPQVKQKEGVFPSLFFWEFIWSDPVGVKETQKGVGSIKKKSIQKHDEFFIY